MFEADDEVGLTAAIVRTEAGAKKYGQPIGSVIVRDVLPSVRMKIPRTPKATTVSIPEADLSAQNVPTPHQGHVPTDDEVQRAGQKISQSRHLRGSKGAAAYLDAAGYNDPPTVLPTEEFEKFQGATVPTYWIGPESLDTFWRGTRLNLNGTDPYTNLTEAPPDEYYVGYGIYSMGTHVGGKGAALEFAGVAAQLAGPPKKSRRYQDGATMVRIKIHPDARIGKFSDVPMGTLDTVQWAVEHHYDVLDLTSTNDNYAGTVILNRSVMVVEELKAKTPEPDKPVPRFSAGSQVKWKRGNGEEWRGEVVRVQDDGMVVVRGEWGGLTALPSTFLHTLEGSKSADTGRVASAGSVAGSGQHVPDRGSHNPELGEVAGGLPAEGRGSVPEDVGAADRAPEALSAAVMRRVRTPEGMQHYHRPMNAVIVKKPPISRLPKVASTGRIKRPATGIDGTAPEWDMLAKVWPDFIAWLKETHGIPKTYDPLEYEQLRREYGLLQGDMGNGYDSVTAGGDSWRWQLRDRTGEWIEMGAEVKWLARGLYRYGLVVGSPSPGMATVKEHITGLLHDLPSSRLEVTKSAAEVMTQVYQSGGDWKRLGLARLPALQDFARRAKADAVSLKGWSSTGEILPDEVVEEIRKISPDEDYVALRQVLWDRLPGLGFSEKEIIAIGAAFDIQRTQRESGRKKLAERDPKALNPLLDEFNDLRKTGNVVIAVPPFSAQAILEDEDRRYKSQFETGESSGLLSNTERTADELRRLGLLSDIKDEQRPVYGFIAPPGEENSEGPDQYGTIRFVLKPGVRERTTMTIGDSLGSRATPVPLTGEVTREQMGDAVAYPAEFSTVHGLGPRFFEDNYVEAQIQGGVSLDDIEKIIIAPQAPGVFRDEINEEIIPVIERLGIPLDDQRGEWAKPKPKIDPNAPHAISVMELQSGDVISDFVEVPGYTSRGPMMVGSIDKVEAAGKTTLIVKGVSLDGSDAGRVVTRMFQPDDKVMLRPDHKVASYDEAVESLRQDLDGLSKNYPDGLATALDKALTDVPPRPVMSEDLSERLTRPDYREYVRKRDELRNRVADLGDADPDSPEWIAAREALLAITPEPGSEIAETVRMLEKYHAERQKWLDLEGISPRSPAAQQILDNVQQIGARARLIVNIESARRLPAKAVPGDADDRRIRREVARDLVKQLVGTVEDTGLITQTWGSGYHNSVMSQRLRPLKPTEKKALTEALLQYPKSWALNFNSIKHTTWFGTRGYNYYDESKREIHINISDPDPKIGLNGDGSPERTVMTHEIGHSMETVIPGLKDLELLFWHSRVEPGDVAMVPDDGALFPADKSVKKRTAMRYTMKTYASPYRRQNYWEVFTTGVQNVLGDGDTDYTYTGKGDTDLWDFTMGALLTLDTTPVKVPDPAAALPVTDTAAVLAATATDTGPVIAAGNSWRWQLRDAEGQWAEMHSEVKWLSKGAQYYGRIIGSPSPGMAEVKDTYTGRVHTVPASHLHVMSTPGALDIPKVAPSGGKSRVPADGRLIEARSAKDYFARRYGGMETIAARRAKQKAAENIGSRMTDVTMADIAAMANEGYSTPALVKTATEWEAAGVPAWVSPHPSGSERLRYITMTEQPGSVRWGTPEAEHLIRVMMAGEITDGWALTSSDPSPQRAAEAEFGIMGAGPVAVWREIPKDLSPKSASQKVHRSYQRAARDLTQAQLRADGIKTVRLYRGTAQNVPAGNQTVKARPLSSWSVDYATARSFAENGSILTADVPVERIVSMPGTGMGCLEEYEMVLSGGPIDVKVQDV